MLETVTQPETVHCRRCHLHLHTHTLGVRVVVTCTMCYNAIMRFPLDRHRKYCLSLSVCVLALVHEIWNRRNLSTGVTNENRSYNSSCGWSA